MKYDEEFKPMGWRPQFNNTSVIHFSLRYLSQLFGIEELADNKLIYGNEYITVDKDINTMIIQSIFRRNHDYVIPRISVVNLAAKLNDVYNDEIAYLEDTFRSIGNFYMQPDFGDDYEIIFDADRRGSFYITVQIRNPLDPVHPHCRKYNTNLMVLAKVNNLDIVVHRIFKDIRDELLIILNRDKVVVAGNIEESLKSFYGMSGGDFDGDVLDKEAAKLQLNSAYGLHGGDILAKGDLTKCVEELKASIFRELGVPESVVNTKEHTAEYEHIMAAIRSTSGNYKGGYMKDYTSMYGKAIKKVIFNDPATIVMWNDGTKTVVKKHGDVEFNGEAAVMYAYVLRWHFNNNRKSMRVWLKQNAKRFEWQSEKPKKVTVTRTSKGKITKASQREIYDAMTPEQKEVVDAMIQDAVKESKKGGKNEDIR